MAKKKSKRALPESAFELARKVRRLRGPGAPQGEAFGACADEIEEWARGWEEHLSLQPGYYLIGLGWIAERLLGHAPRRSRCGAPLLESRLLLTDKPRLLRCQKPNGHAGTHAENSDGMGSNWSKRSKKAEQADLRLFEERMVEHSARLRAEKQEAEKKQDRNRLFARRAARLVALRYGKDWSAKVLLSGRAVLLAPPKGPGRWRGNEPTLGYNLLAVKRALELGIGRGEVRS